MRLNKVEKLSWLSVVPEAQGGPHDGQINEEGKDTVDSMESDRVIGKQKIN